MISYRVYRWFLDEIGRQPKLIELVPTEDHSAAYRQYARAVKREVTTLTETEKREALVAHIAGRCMEILWMEGTGEGGQPIGLLGSEAPCLH